MNEQEKTCNNCKYSNGWHDPDPCNTCRFLADDRNNWEPKEEEPMDEIKLKPCPFCGRVPMVDDCGDNRYFVRCKCGISQDKLYGQRCDAVRRWNTRKPSAQQWIPVSERLPEEKTNVLILADTIAGKMAKVSFLYKDDEGRVCWTGLDVYGLNPCDWQPTHWMPLPEPY